MKTIASLAFLALVLASPVSVRAQEVQDDATKKAVDAVQTERLELAKKINEVLPPARQIEQSLNQVADQWGLQEKDKFRREMMAEIDVAGIEKKSADTMAELFTKDELELMLAYYSSPLQVKIAEKMPVYQGLIQPFLSKEVDRALMKLRTGYETQFRKEDEQKPAP